MFFFLIIIKIDIDTKTIKKDRMYVNFLFFKYIDLHLIINTL
jgi:hypothetical protein